MEQRWKNLFIIVCSFLVAFPTANGTPSRTYKYSKSLLTTNNEKPYSLWWNINSTHIEIAVEVATTGWIGFGFSANGQMTDSDVFQGWFASGVGNVRDGNVGSEHSLNIDTTNNYQLLASSETTVTTIEVLRLLNTGDSEDRVINPLATTNVIFSYRTSDSVASQHSDYGSTTIIFNPDATVPGNVTFTTSLITSTVITITWSVPTIDGGLPITKVALERQVDISWISLSNSTQITSFTVNALTPSTTYKFRMYAVNQLGNGEMIEKSFTTDAPAPASPPDAPAVPTKGIVTASSISVSWASPGNDGGSPVTYFTLQQDDGTESQSPTWTTVYNGSSTTFTNSGLSQGAYRYRVSASNSAGTSSYSTAVTIVTTGYLAKGILPGEFTHSVSLLGGRYKLHWELAAMDTLDHEIIIGIETEGTGYVGFGLGNQMYGADIIAGWVVGSTVTIGDYSGVGKQTPSADTESNILQYNGQEINGNTTLKFRRKMKTGDPSDIIIAPGQTSIIFSYSRNVDNLGNGHLQTDRGTSNVLLYTTTCPNECHYPQGICVSNACNCTIGYRGTDCSTVDNCIEDSQCNNGTCVGGSCHCFDGYNGDFCEDSDGGLTKNIVDGYYSFSASLLNGGVELYWKITDDQIEIALKSDGQGYIGFGFGHSMKNCDIYLGWVSSDGKVTMMDTWTTEQDVPPSDESQGGKNDILAYVGEEDGQSTTLKFVRKLNTGDSKDKVIEKGSIDCLIAYSSSDALVQHKGSNVANLVVDFYSGTVSTEANAKKTAHGVLMAFAWGFFTIIGVFLAKFFKKIGKVWFILHASLNVITIICTIIAFAIAVDMVDDDFVQEDQLALSHAWIGLLVFLGTPLQGFLGWYSDFTYKEERKSTPFWPDKFHWWVGRILILLGVLNIFLGMFSLEIASGYIIAYGVWIGVAIALYILFLFKFKNQGHRRLWTDNSRNNSVVADNELEEKTTDE